MADTHSITPASDLAPGDDGRVPQDEALTTFVSYAQNLEDVMLWRALKEIGRGFYIDVGANDPEEHSVTKAFYDRGWSGVNIEPTEEYFRRLQADRPRDMNLRELASSAVGEQPFFHIPRTGLSTTERAVAEQHRRTGYAVTQVMTRATTLAQVCDDHVRGEVHFLKIDVEGGTLAVLEGMDFGRVRPWVVLVEATAPMTQTETFAQWEHLLVDRGYRFVYADGLNRFYLSDEHADLADRFRYPPNVFDDYRLTARAAQPDAALTSQVAQLQSEVEDAHAVIEALRARAEHAAVEHDELQAALSSQIARNRDAEQRAYAAEQAREVERRNAAFHDGRLAHEASLVTRVLARLDEREALLRAVFESTSWRATRPLRVLGALAKGAPLADHTPPALPLPLRPTLFIECTHTYQSDLNTGIQRVVRNVLRNAAEAAAAHGFDVVPVVAEDGGLRITDVASVLAGEQATLTPPPPAPPPPPGRKRALWRLALRVLSAVLPFPLARRLIYAPPDRPGLARALLLLAGRGRGATAPAPAPPRQAVSLDDYDRLDGSILLLLDSSWTIPIWPGARRFKERGGSVYGVVYDLIPISHSHTSVPELVASFKGWVAEHLSVSDGFVCISRTIAGSLDDYVREVSGGPTRLSDAPIGHFHLGSELDLIEPSGEVRPYIRDVFRPDRHVFLMVGSIEPRKMHGYVLDAFDLFWARGGSAALVIVGKHGWKTEDFLERVVAHPRAGTELFLLRDATDGELDFCYRQSSSLVIASEIEGFGLPVVEAFQRGLPVMCSDIPVFREIAEGRAKFFSLSDASELTREIEEFCARVPVASRGDRRPGEWISWRESTEQLLAEIVRFHTTLAPAALAHA